MRSSLIWRAVLIALLAAFAVWRAWPPEEKLKLGLDLQGGIHLVLGVETQDAVRSETEKDLEVLRREAADEGVSLATNRLEDTSFEATGFPADKVEALDTVARDWLRDGWEWRQDGPQRLVFSMKSGNERTIRESAVNQALQTIRNRVDAYGVGEQLIARQGGTNRIVVQLPGVDDPQRVKELIGRTAFLEFRLCEFPWNGGGVASRAEILANYGGQLPDNVEIFPSRERDPATGRVVSESFYAVQKRQVITGRDLKSASPSQGQLGEPVVLFHLSVEGSRFFGEATGSNVGRGLAIILDNEVVSAPTINARITDSGIIEGNFSQQEVMDLVTTLRSGALPASITFLEDRTVGPSLGQDSIDSGLRAGLYGSLLVVLFMLVVYKLSGVNSLVALMLNVLLLFGALAGFGATLTLPGIAGIVLTIGMAVDASVLVFERIKEELRAGKTARSAIDAGFSNALSSIMDANITTLIAALFLFQFGTGPVRGFAVTLSIGIFGTLFCGVFVSRWLFDLLYANRPSARQISI
jgi:preprotein translocase subunit SecD